jgi:hypothetical protein
MSVGKLARIRIYIMYHQYSMKEVRSRLLAIFFLQILIGQSDFTEEKILDGKYLTTPIFP